MFIAVVIINEVHAVRGSNGRSDGRFATLAKAKDAVDSYVGGCVGSPYYAFIVDCDKGKVVSTAGTPPKPLTWIDVEV